MLQTTNALRKYQLLAKDGLVGWVEDFYFDDEHWTIRYLVVRTGTWLMGRDVLISPIALRGCDPAHKCILTDLTQEKIENSPSINTAEPISRRHEREYFQYYGWPYYWGGSMAWGWSGVPTPLLGETSPPRDFPEETPSTDVHLRSAQEISGYHIQAQDQEIGHVEDFIVDEKTWSITDIVVDTRNWWPGKKVLLPHRTIENVSWVDRVIAVGLTHDQIQEAPEFEPGGGLTEEYHKRVNEYYDHQPVLK